MRRLTAVALAAVAVAAGCGDDDEDQPAAETQTVTQTETAPAETTEPETTTEAEPEGGAQATEAEAEESAREEATAQLENQPGGFSVAEGDWMVTCTGGEGGGPWACKVESGPCSGTVTVTPQDDGSRLAEAKVGCIAE
jgi:hypothetical protein